MASSCFSAFRACSSDDEARIAAELSNASMPSTSSSSTPLKFGTPELTVVDRMAQDSTINVDLQYLKHAPARFELMSHTSTFKWETTAKNAKKLIGPMREWAEEFQCRTGVAVDAEPRNPERLAAGAYPSRDDVEMDVYFFGPSKAVEDAKNFIKAMVSQSPSHVRVAIYRKTAVEGEVEWLMLRRINSEGRPADIPAISLKTPGKYTMLFENLEEAAIRSVWEETGVDLDKSALTKTNFFSDGPVPFWWRPDVHYWLAELPPDTEVTGPQALRRNYLVDWDVRSMKASSDPTDRVWATIADPMTGCAWMPASLIDELQAPIKNVENYMESRYLPAPESAHRPIVKLEKADKKAAA